MYFITDKEVWKDVKDYEGYYQVSDLGKVKSLDRLIVNRLGHKSNLKGKELKPGVTRDGYELVVISNGRKKKTTTVHRLVAETFFGESDLEVNHINGDKTDNSVRNLEYVTGSENMQHSFDNGLRKNKINREEADEIRDLYANTNLTQPEIGKIYGISKNMVSDIWLNKKWK